MKQMSKFTLAILSIACFTAYASAAEHAAHWSYDKETGPAHWGELAQENVMCKTGMQQSPIDLQPRSAERIGEKDFQINYHPTKVNVINNGHTIQAGSTEQANTISFKGKNYRLAQFHFHTPSEHTITHKNYPMEMHMVNTDENGNITVVGVFIEQGKENKMLAPVFSKLPVKPLTPKEKADEPTEVDLMALLPSDQKAMVYSGSLTTPPCSEQVNWIVMETPIEMSKSQIAAFQSIFSDNHRPVQKLNNRQVVTE
ncbi:MAG: carbonic anhydrase family protein [Burkholderiaceae bacterium]|jgi:carbonic anhydrase|nr:carbonic anhydrase family protein [Burkholderiaceae bacterium]